MAKLIRVPGFTGPVAATGPGATLNDAIMWHTMGQFDNVNTMEDDTYTGVRPNTLLAQDLIVGAGNPPTFVTSTPTGGPALTADYKSSNLETNGVPNTSAQHMNLRGQGDHSWSCFVRLNLAQPYPTFPKSFHGYFDNGLPISFALYYFGIQRISGVDNIIWNCVDSAGAGVLILRPAVAQGVWVHWAGTRRNSDGLTTLYQNGVSVGTSTVTTYTPNSTGYSFQLAFIPSGSLTDMGMCNLGLWNRLITPLVEIPFLAAGGKPSLANAL